MSRIALFPGNWEGDLVLGAGSRSAIGTLVERVTRFTLLLDLPDDKSAVNVEHAIRIEIGKLPQHLRRSITWDQGAAISNHASFTVATGIPIYFCDPLPEMNAHSSKNPWSTSTSSAHPERELKSLLGRYSDIALVPLLGIRITGVHSKRSFIQHRI